MYSKVPGQRTLVVYDHSIKDRGRVLGYALTLLTWNQRMLQCEKREVLIARKNVYKTFSDTTKFITCNFSTSRDNKIISNSVKLTSRKDVNTALKVASSVRKLVSLEWGTGIALSGHCIEASEMIAYAINLILHGEFARTVEGYCLYDDEEYGSDRPYSEHTWVQTSIHGLEYIDVTADQFNVAMYPEHQYKNIHYSSNLPYGIMVNQPREGIDYWIDD